MKVHFTGCLGASMKRLRELTERLGHETSGSDLRLFGHSAENVAGCDLVVYTAAAGEDNVELVAARRAGIPTEERAKYLARISGGFGRTIAVAGTHGKTTTTGMVAAALGSRRPTVHLGGELVAPPAVEEREYFVTEACEYRRSMLALSPSVAVILNAELDHTDCYRDVGEVRAAFAAFKARSEFTLCNGDDRALASLIGREKTMTFGLEKDNDFAAGDIAVDGENRPSFSLTASGLYLGRISLGIPGRHNVYNALAAASVALTEGVSFSEIARALSEFRGVRRRCEFLGRARGASVYSDYAHHPTEIRASVAALKRDRRLLVAFEPHTFSRTRDLFEGFASCFGGADEVLLLPVFGSRESGGMVGSAELCAAIGKRQPSRLFGGYDELSGYILSSVRAGDAVVYMGAGTIDAAGRELVAREKAVMRQT